MNINIKAWRATYKKRFAKPKAVKPKAETEKPKVETAVAEKLKPKPKAEKPKAAKPKAEKPKQNTKTQVLAADPANLPDCKKVMKTIESIKKFRDKSKTVHLEIWEENGKRYCTDSYRIIRTELNGVKAETDNVPYSGMDRLFRDNERTEKLTVPDIKELKALVKETKERSGAKRNALALYVFDNGLAVNVKYLIDGVIATGTNDFWYGGNNKSPILFESEDGKTEYLCCPVRKRNKNESGVVIAA